MRKLLLALAGTVLLGSLASSQGGPWRAGRRLPELRLPTIDGDRTIDLAELRGKRVLLVEFASW